MYDTNQHDCYFNKNTVLFSVPLSKPHSHSKGSENSSIIHKNCAKNDEKIMVISYQGIFHSVPVPVITLHVKDDKLYFKNRFS